MNHHPSTILEDDVKEPVRHLLRERLPWLTVGLIGGMFTTFLVSQYEEILQADLRLAFFIPIIVYMSDAIGTQTETIYIRHLKKTGSDFKKYLLKETLLGLALGLIYGIGLGVFAYSWLDSWNIAITIGLSMMVTSSISPILATIIPNILYREHSDPALGAGPLATIIQDFLSLMIYFLIASIIMVR